MTEPIKHHFIPQFILKNFVNDSEQIYYWNKKTQKIENRNTKSIFMIKNLYRDEKNHPTDPAIIEKKFAILESKVAILFKEKIIDKNPIVITRTDNELLRKFLYLLSFRSETRKKQYIDANFDDITKKHLDKYVTNEDYVDLWLKEIETIIDSESHHELSENEHVSWTIRTDYVGHLMNYYMTFVTPRGQEFIISDVYPTAEIFPLGMVNANLYPHFIYPITPNLLLVLNHMAFKDVSANYIFTVEQMVHYSNIKGNAIVPPKAKYVQKNLLNKDDEYTYQLNKLYLRDVTYFNVLMLNETRKGFSFKELSKVKESIKEYQSLNKTKNNDFSKLLAHL